MSAALHSAATRGGILTIEQDVTVEAAAYSSGDLVGGLLTLTHPLADGGGTSTYPTGGLIQSVLITDLAAQNIDKDVVFFDTNPSNTTFTENSALDIDDADLLNVIGVAAIDTWFSFSDNSCGQALNLAIPFILPAAATALYAAIVERGAPTYVSTSDLSIRVGMMPV